VDLKQLEYFVRVVELGSFTRAAAMLHVAQPALSRQVRQLELELRTPLLVRNGRGVTTTPSGERLLEHGRGILRQVARAKQDIEDANTKRAGRIAIGMPASIAEALTTPLIERLRRELADATITVLQGRSTQLQEWLWSGRLDMAVLFDAPASPLLESTDLLIERLYLVSSKSNASGPKSIQVKDLPNYPMIISSRPNTVRIVVDSELARIGQKLNLAFEIDAVGTTFELVSGGYGHTIRSLRTKRTNAAKHLIYRPIIKPNLYIRMQLVLPARRLNNPVLDAAIALLRDLCVSVLG
jgi:LysR family transcriptional regulator, nitrogen assimilation regulatory protein